MGFMLALLAVSPVPAPAQGAPRPTWIDVLPDRPGRLYAMGLANLGANESESIKLAAQNARLEVVSRLRASIQGVTQIQSSTVLHQEVGGATTGSRHRVVDQSSKVSAHAIDLPGLGLAETWTDTKGRAVYALAFLDVANSLLDLQGRLDQVNGLLTAQVPEQPRDRARAIQGLKKGRAELQKLEEWADLLAVGAGAPLVRADVRNAEKALQERLDGLKLAFTLSLVAGNLPSELSTMVQCAALAQGLGWSNGKSAFTARLQVMAQGKDGAWWGVVEDAGFITAQGILQLTLADPAGNLYQAPPIEAKGIGTSTPSAYQALLKEGQKKLEASFDHWLSDLAL
jgi:hypothetical protein